MKKAKAPKEKPETAPRTARLTPEQVESRKAQELTEIARYLAEDRERWG